MDQYYVKDNRVFTQLRADDNDKDERTWRIVKNVLVLTSVVKLSEAAIKNEIVHVYAACQACMPVFTQGDSSFLGYVQHHQPWCEWALTILDSKIVKTNTDKVESRNALRKRLLKDGARPLPDSDRMVQKALAKWKADRL